MRRYRWGMMALASAGLLSLHAPEALGSLTYPGAGTTYIQELGYATVGPSVVDSANGYAYYYLLQSGSGSQAGKFVRVNLSNMSEEATFTAGIPNGFVPYVALIDTTQGFAYFVDNQGLLLQIDIKSGDTFRIWATTNLTLPPSYSLSVGFVAGVIDPNGGYAYFGTGGSPGPVIVQMSLSNLNNQTDLTLDPSQNLGPVQSATIDTAGGHMYFGFQGYVVEISTGTMGVIGAPLALPQNNVNAMTAALDTNAGNQGVFYGINPTSTGINVVKSDLGNTTLSSSANIGNGATFGSNTMVIDPSINSVFLVTGVGALGTQYGIAIYQLQASNLQVLDSLILPDSDFSNGAYGNPAFGNFNLAIDPSGKKLYIGATYSYEEGYSPGSQIIQVGYDSTSQTLPLITTLTPSTTAAGSPTFTLDVQGSNFTSSEFVIFNGTQTATYLVNAGLLQATIQASYINNPETAFVGVANNANSLSSVVPFSITGAYISLNPGSMTFKAIQGNVNPSTQTFTIGYGGPPGSSIDWAYSLDGWPSWVYPLPSPTSGTGLASGGHTDPIPLGVDITGKSPGSYTISTNVNAVNPPFAVASANFSVNLIVAPPPVIALNPASLSFIAFQNDAKPPAAKTFMVSNSGPSGSSLDWALAIQAPAPAWMNQPSLTSGTGVGSGLSTNPISVSVNTTNLAPNIYTSSITVSDPSDAFIAFSTLSITYTVFSTIPPTARLTVTPPTGQEKKTTFTADGSGSTAVFPATVAHYDFYWGDGSSDTITTFPITSATHIYTSSGIYVSSLTVTDSAGLVSAPVTQTITVFTPSAIALNPTSLTFNAIAGGPDPAAQSFTVSNAGPAGSSLDWSFPATGLPAWMSPLPSPTSGTGLASGSASGPISVAVHISGLAPGTYNTTLTVSDPNDASIAPVMLPVTLIIAPTPAIALNPISLTFNAIAGGPDPAAQSFTVSNAGPSGSSLDWSFLTSGLPAWMNPLPSPISGTGLASGSASGPISVAVHISGLAPGTYTTSITVGDPNDSSITPVTLPVTLIIAPTPAIALNPTSLTFNAIAGGPDPAAQSFTVSNAGPAGSSLVWSFSTSGLPAWMSPLPSPTSGTGLASGSASGPISVAVHISGLAPGTYNTSIVVGDPNDPSIPLLTLPVTLVVAQTPAIGLNPTFLTFNAIAGGSNPAAQSFTVSNAGPSGSSLDWSFLTSGLPAWMNPLPSPISGTGLASGSASGPISVSVNMAGLTAGTYTASITVSDPNDASIAPVTLPVTLIIAPTPAIALNPTSLTFNAIAGGPDPAAQSFTVSNAGPSGSSLDWSFSTSGLPAWMSPLPSPTSGTGLASGSASGPISVAVHISGLAPGTYNTTLTVSDPNDASIAPVMLPVTLIIAPTPAIALNPISLTFNAIAGGPDPAAQSFTVSNAGLSGSSLDWSFLTSGLPAWMNPLPSPISGTGLASGSASGPISVSVNMAGLTAGTYTASITVSDPNDSSITPVTLPVTLIIAPTPAIALNPTSLTFNAIAGGPDPAAQSFTVSNAGPTGSSLDWSFPTSSLPAWMNPLPSPTSGTGLAAGSASGPIMVSVNIAGLAPGTYTTSITVSDPNDSSITPVTLSVTLVVAQTPAITLNPTSLTFNGIAGGPDPAAQTFTVSNTGPSGSSLDWSFDASGLPAWMNPLPSPISGTGLASGSASGPISVSVNMAGLTAGTYTASITVSDPNDSSITPVTLPVTLIIAPTPAIALNPTSLTFNAIAGGPDPAAQSFTVSNAGPSGSSLDWSFLTSGLPAWMNPLPSPISGTGLASGSASGPISVAVHISGLAPGTYTTSITVGDPNDSSITPVTLPVTLIIAPTPAIALNPTSLTFNAIAGGPDPAAQSFTVSNAGPSGSSLDWSFLTSGLPAWMNPLPSPTSGTGLASGSASGPISVAVHISGLAPGTYNTSIVVGDPNDPSIPLLTLPVTLVVAQTPAIGLNPTFLTFNAIAGGSNPAAQSFTVSNAGPSGSSLDWSFLTSGLPAWMNPLPSPISGTGLASGSASGPISVSVNMAGLTAGTYTASITVSDPNDASIAPVTLPVTLIIAPTPAIALNPTSLTFNAIAGGPDPAAQSFTVSNAGPSGSSLDWSFSTSGLPAWMSPLPSPTSGTGLASGSASGPISVAVHISGLAPGTYNTTLTVSDPNDASIAPVMFPVTLIIAPTPAIALKPTSLTFNAIAGGPDPAAQSFTVSNAGPNGSSLDWSFPATGLPAWMSPLPSPTSGTGLASRASSTPITASVHIAGLAPGTYTTSITVSDSNDASIAPVTLPVTLVVAQIPAIALNPTSLTFNAIAGGPDPAAQSFTVSNAGPSGSSLDWSFLTSGLPAWMNPLPSPISGTGLASGSASGPITVSVHIADLPPGTYNTTLTVSDPNDASIASVTLPVTLTLQIPSYLTKIVFIDPPTPPGGGLPIKTIRPQDLASLQVQAFNQFGQPMDGSSLNWNLDNKAAGSLSAAGTQGTFRVTSGVIGAETFTVTVSSRNTLGNPVQAQAQITVINASSMFTGNICGGHAYPVPWKPSLGVDHITFTGLGPGADIRIFTSDARLVRELKSNVGEDVQWDLKNSEGNTVASWVYPYIIEQAGGVCSTAKGKLVVIR